MKSTNTNNQCKKEDANDSVKHSEAICVVSSMAPRLILEQLLADYSNETGIKTQLTAMGGIDAAERVKNDDTVDIIVLGKDSISTLTDAGQLYSEIQDIALSEVAVAVKSGVSRPDLSHEESVKKAILNAQSVAYSTGPSGRALAALFQRWGISEEIAERLLCPPSGVPVGSLVAAGDVEIGFQQRSELIHIEGIDILGPLPEAIQIKTIFTAGICKRTHKHAAANDLIEFLSSPKADTAIRLQGMLPL